MSTFDDDVIKVQKTHEVVAERLRRQIVRGQLKVGDRLPPEEELTATYGIARTTLREALRVLESQGLIAIRRGRGGGPVVTAPEMAPLAQALAVSLQLQGATIGDLDEARQLLESHIVMLLAKEHTDDDLDALRAIVKDAARAAEATDATAFGIAATEFHRSLGTHSRNLTISTLSQLLQGLVDAYYKTGAERSSQKDLRRASRSYAKLVDLIEAGQAEAAAEHWHGLMAYTIGGLGRDQPLDMYR